MENYDKVKKLLEGNEEVVEIQVEYLNGETTDYALMDGESRSDAIRNMLDAVDWAQVGEIEVELADGSKTEFDLYDGEEGTLQAIDEDEEDEEDEEEDEDEV